MFCHVLPRRQDSHSYVASLFTSFHIHILEMDKLYNYQLNKLSIPSTTSFACCILMFILSVLAHFKLISSYFHIFMLYHFLTDFGFVLSVLHGCFFPLSAQVKRCWVPGRCHHAWPAAWRNMGNSILHGHGRFNGKHINCGCLRYGGFHKWGNP